MSVGKVMCVELVAWLGEDEFGSGQVGLKQARVPAGLIPMVAIREHEAKLRAVKPQLEVQARAFGQRIYLCRFTFAEVLDKTESGQ